MVDDLATLEYIDEVEICTLFIIGLGLLDKLVFVLMVDFCPPIWCIKLRKYILHSSCSKVNTSKFTSIDFTLLFRES